MTETEALQAILALCDEAVETVGWYHRRVHSDRIRLILDQVIPSR